MDLSITTAITIANSYFFVECDGVTTNSVVGSIAPNYTVNKVTDVNHKVGDTKRVALTEDTKAMIATDTKDVEELNALVVFIYNSINEEH